MPGKFVVKKGPTGKFRFDLLSTNGQVVATSEAYNQGVGSGGVSGQGRRAAQEGGQEGGEKDHFGRQEDLRDGSRRPVVVTAQVTSP